MGKRSAPQRLSAIAEHDVVMRYADSTIAAPLFGLLLAPPAYDETPWHIMDRSESPAPHPSRNRSSADAGSNALNPEHLFGAYPPALVEATLDRVMGSQTFRRSPRHRHFLDHVVRAALAGENERLKEVIIGLEVFGKQLPHYDPRQDPIVRVEAGRVREKLARYYRIEGANDAFEIVIPVGGYLPHLAHRTTSNHKLSNLGSLAVLPFTNLSGHREDASFAIGLADQLIDTLGRVPGLKVVARVSAFMAQEKGMDLKSIGRLLGVNKVIEGSLQRSGSRMRCIAHLSRTKDGVRIWSDRFEHDCEHDGHLFSFQDRIADGVLEATRLAVVESAGERTSSYRGILAKPIGTDNKLARDLFERARYVSQLGTIEGYRKAIELLENAIALDPSFAQAYSHLAAARANLSPFIFEPAIPSFAKVKRAALRALELDPLDGDARALLAVIAHRVEANWRAAEPMFREALRIAPSSILAHTTYSWGLVFNGRFGEAMQHARMALELDPLNLSIRAHNARLYSYARDYELAISELRVVLDLEPDHVYSHLVLGMIHLSMGNHESAMPEFEFVVRKVPEHSSAHFHTICVYGMRGEIARGKRELDELIARIGDAHYSPFNVALARACLGDREGALASLDEAARIRDYLFVSAPAHVLFDRYRNDPAFIDLLHRHQLELLPPWPPEPMVRGSTTESA